MEFDGGATLTASTTLTVLPGTTGKHNRTNSTSVPVLPTQQLCLFVMIFLMAGYKVVAGVNGRTPKRKGPWTNNVFGVQLWIWIAVGASSLVLIGVIIVIVYVQRRNKRIKVRQEERKQ